MATLKTVLHPKTDNHGNKQYRLALRLTVDRKRAYYHLGYNIDPNEWDGHAQKVKSIHPKHKQLNRLIRKKFDEIEDILFELDSSKQNYSAKEVINTIRKRTNQQGFFQLAEEHIEDLFKANKYNRAISDRSKINRVKEFAQNPQLTFEEINPQFLKKMKIHLMNQRGISERSVMNIFVLIRLLFNNAITKNMVDVKFYPFGKGKIRIKYPQTIKIGLNENEILKIENLDLEEGTSIWHTRNVFLFSFYLAGVRISDVLQMKWKDIVGDRLYYKMGKNNKVDSLKLPPRVIEILKNYHSGETSKNEYIFPELKSVTKNNAKGIYSRTKTAIKKFNANLKTISELAEINKKITNHIARHSFGNIAGDKVSPQMLQKLYRHTHLSTTIGYQGNFIHKNTDEALDAIVNFSK